MPPPIYYVLRDEKWNKWQGIIGRATSHDRRALKNNIDCSWLLWLAEQSCPDRIILGVIGALVIGLMPGLLFERLTAVVVLRSNFNFYLKHYR
jgi:hypothetical protein